MKAVSSSISVKKRIFLGLVWFGNIFFVTLRFDMCLESFVGNSNNALIINLI